MNTSTPLLAALVSVSLLVGSATVTAQEKSKPTTSQLIEQLGDPDYETRKSAEQQLLRHGEKVLEALKKSAGSHDDPEVQWRAGRLVRRIQAGGKGERKTLGKRDRKAETPPTEGGARDRDRASVRRGDRSPRRRSSEDVLEQLDRVFDGRGFDRDTRKEIERAMEEMRKSMRRFDFGGGIEFGPGRGFKFDAGMNRSMKMEQGPDGVRVEITEKDEDGKPVKKVYAAGSMEAFRKKHPGILDREVGNDPFRIGFQDFPFRGGFRVFGPGGDRRESVKQESGKKEAGKKELRRQSDRRNVERVEATEGKKLGFHVGEISPEIRRYLGLEGGLMVAAVVDGTTAAKLGLRKGDIVLEVGEHRIHDVPDVARALDQIGDGEVTVRVIRRGRELDLPK